MVYYDNAVSILANDRVGNHAVDRYIPIPLYKMLPASHLPWSEPEQCTIDIKDFGVSHQQFDYYELDLSTYIFSERGSPRKRRRMSCMPIFKPGR